MKKTIVTILALALIAPFLYSCTKSCTCEKPGEKTKEVEIKPSEKCSDYSNSTRGNCS